MCFPRTQQMSSRQLLIISLINVTYVGRMLLWLQRELWYNSKTHLLSSPDKNLGGPGFLVAWAILEAFKARSHRAFSKLI